MPALSASQTAHSGQFSQILVYLCEHLCTICTILLTVWGGSLNLSAIGHPVAHTPLEAPVYTNPQLNPNANPAAFPPD